METQFKGIFTTMAISALGMPLHMDAAEKGEAMNVIYILVDDLGYGDLGCYGQEKFVTPHIDKMAKEGMRFTQHYAGCSVSAPSRCAVMTGLHTGNAQIRGNMEISPEGQAPMDANTFTVAHLMKDAGYATGLFGKWGLGAPGSASTPNKMGFDEFYGYNCQRSAHTFYPTYLYDNDTRVDIPENRNKNYKVFSQDLIHQRGLDFIRSNKDKPFFAVLTYTLPHAELNLPHDHFYEQYVGKFEEVKPYISKNGFVQGRGGYNTCMTPRTTFAAMVTRLDHYVGEVLAELRKQGLDENTIVMFTSDNGPHIEGGADPRFFNSSGPLKGTKRALYEGGIRVPLIAWAPTHIEEGQESDHISAFWDLMPTLADIVSYDGKFESDGISFLPTLVDKGRQKNHDYLYWEFHEEGGRQAIRKGDWKLIKQPLRGKTRYELYDLSKDIHEDHNVAAENPKVLKKMTSILEEARTDNENFQF